MAGYVVGVERYEPLSSRSIRPGRLVPRDSGRAPAGHVHAVPAGETTAICDHPLVDVTADPWPPRSSFLSMCPRCLQQLAKRG